MWTQKDMRYFQPLLAVTLLFVLLVLFGLYVSHSYRQSALRATHVRIIVPTGFEGPIFIYEDDAKAPAEIQTLTLTQNRENRSVKGYVFYAQASGATPIAVDDMKVFSEWHGSDVYDIAGKKLQAYDSMRSSYFDDYSDGIWILVGENATNRFLRGEGSNALQREWRAEHLPKRSSREH